MEKVAESKRAMKAALKPFVGKWVIVEMETWDQEFVNMEGPGHFTFRKDGTGHVRRKALVQRLAKAGIWEDR